MTKVMSFDEDDKFLNMEPLNLLLKNFKRKCFGLICYRSIEKIFKSQKNCES